MQVQNGEFRIKNVLNMIFRCRFLCLIIKFFHNTASFSFFMMKIWWFRPKKCQIGLTISKNWAPNCQLCTPCFTQFTCASLENKTNNKQKIFLEAQIESKEKTFYKLIKHQSTISLWRESEWFDLSKR